MAMGGREGKGQSSSASSPDEWELPMPFQASRPVQGAGSTDSQLFADDFYMHYARSTASSWLDGVDATASEAASTRMASASAATTAATSSRSNSGPTPEVELLQIQQIQDQPIPRNSHDRVPLTPEMVLDAEITTLMVAKFPPQCTQDWLVGMLIEGGFQWHFDYVYMPLQDMATYTSKGYAFINMTTVEAASRLVAEWTGLCFLDQEYLDRRGTYAMSFSAADIQGLESLLQKMRRSKLARLRNPHIRPWVAPFVQWQR